MTIVRRFAIVAFTACLGAIPIVARAGPEAEPSRGALLYEVHCGACHTAQAHWRQKRLVRDWASLIREVSRWQANANLEWSADDIDAVARYLDHVYYRLPVQAAPALPDRG